MLKLLLWGFIFFIGYMYLKPKLDAGQPREDVLDDDDDFITIKIPKKKTKKDEEELTDFEEIN
jgi:hypothetical protein